MRDKFSITNDKGSTNIAKDNATINVTYDGEILKKYSTPRYVLLIRLILIISMIFLMVFLISVPSKKINSKDLIIGSTPKDVFKKLKVYLRENGQVYNCEDEKFYNSALNFYYQGKYKEAYKYFNKFKRKPLDSYYLILKNNCKILMNNTDIVGIVIAAPFTSEKSSEKAFKELMGIEIIKNDLNEKIKGNMIIYLFNDSGTQEKEKMASKIMNIGQVKAIIGHLSSQKTLDYENIYTDILLISPTSSSDELSKKENVYRVCFTDKEYATCLTNKAKKCTYGRNIVVIYESDDDHSESIKSMIEKKMEDYVVNKIDLKDMANTQIVESAIDYNSDVYFLFGSDERIAEIITKIKKLEEQNNRSQTAKFFCSDSSYTKKFLKKLEHNSKNEGIPLFENVYHSVLYIANNDDDFTKKIDKKFGGYPNFRAAAVYDCTKIINECICELNDNRELIKNRVKTVNISGLTGTIKFKLNGDREKQNEPILTEINEDYEFIKAE